MMSLTRLGETALVGTMAETVDQTTKADGKAGSGRVNRESRETVGRQFVENPRMSCRHVNVFYGDKQALQNVSIDIGRNEVLAMIGPSGCGKSTFIRCLNRMNDTIEGCRVTGDILLDGVSIHDKGVDVVPLRAQVGMVFQKPNPFPKSIYENVAYGPRIHGLAPQLSQVFMNLIVNAAQSMTDRGTLTLTTRAHGDKVSVCIADTGHGMSAEAQAQLFTPFASSRDGGSGMGLGLAISQAIVTKHGGRIQVESEPGVGSQFTVYLPLQPPARMAAPAPH